MEISKLEKIEDLFRVYDFQNLNSKLYHNKDEYNREALYLALKLNCYDSVASIQQKVWDIIYNSFCISYSRQWKRGRFIVKKEIKEAAILKIGTLDKYLEFSHKIKAILDE